MAAITMAKVDLWRVRLALKTLRRDLREAIAAAPAPRSGGASLVIVQDRHNPQDRFVGFRSFGPLNNHLSSFRHNLPVCVVGSTE